MKNIDKFKIEKNDYSNLDELIELSKTYYKEGDIINKQYFQWQYLNNPTGKPFLFVSRNVSNQELAGQYLVLPVMFKILGQNILGTLSLNTLTNPKYQGKGLFTKMAKATYKDCANNNAYFTIGFPNPQSYPGFVRKLNFEHLNDIPLLIKPIRYGRILFSYLKKNKKKHGGNIEINQVDLKNIKSFDFDDHNIKDKYNEFWDNVSKQYNISTFKDFAFLKWRYYDIPTRDYKLFYYEEENQIKGLIVLKAENVWGFNVGLIMDLLVLDNNKNVGKKLLSYAKKIYRQSDIDFMAILHNKSYEFSILKKSGYFKVPQKILPQKIHFIVRLNKDFVNSQMLFDLKNWKLTFGDYDVF